MKIKYLLSIVIIYFLVLFENSFLEHFAVFGFVFSPALILVIIYNILENEKKFFGVYLALISGFFLDVFSDHFIGYNILILILLSLFLKLVFNKYVSFPFKKI